MKNVSKKWQFRSIFVSLFAIAMGTGGALLAGGALYKMSQYGGITVWFDPDTIAHGDILTKITVVPETGGSFDGANKHSMYRAVPFPTVTLYPPLEGRWTDIQAGVAGVTEDVTGRAGRATIYNSYPSNGLHLPVYTFDPTLEQFIDTRVRLPDHLADTGTVTYTIAWTEQSGETGKKAVWRVQTMSLASGDTLNVSPLYQTVAGLTTNASTTMHVAQIVTSVSDLAWDEGDVVFIQLARDAGNADDTATNAVNLHDFSIEVPIITHRTP